MAVYAAANIAMAVENFKERGYATLGGVILNRRNVENEKEKVEVLCNDIHSSIVGDLPRDEHVASSEGNRKPVFEMYPDCDYCNEIRRIARYMIEHGENHE